ncbi:hypothetical protein SNE40_022594 [Patella caerulea]|uniref:MRC n=1 Tax=Patella caerulea TaxID=87958 RepID=A0AAN8GFV7_PATCE
MGGDLSGLAIIVTFTMVCVSSKCPEFVFRLTEFKNYLVSNYQQRFVNLSANGCGGKCIERSNCQSFSYQFGENINECFTFNGRAWSGQNATYRKGMVTYWRLEDRCPSDYVYDIASNVCYKTYNQTTDKTTWMGAMEICQAEGGHLFICNSDEKWNIIDNLDGSIYPYVANPYTHVFVGATFTADKWAWLDGSNITDWEVTEPNDDTEHCAILYVKSNRRLSLTADYECQSITNFICEIPVHSINL